MNTEQQQPRPNRIRIADLRTKSECIAYMKAEALALRKHSASRRGRPVSPVTANMFAGFWLSVLNRYDEIDRGNPRPQPEPDEPAVTVFVTSGAATPDETMAAIARRAEELLGTPEGMAKALELEPGEKE